MTKTEYTDKLREMVYDVNAAEIASHIENDSLRQWIYAWASEMLNRIYMIDLIDEGGGRQGMIKVGIVLWFGGMFVGWFAHALYRSSVELYRDRKEIYSGGNGE